MTTYNFNVLSDIYKKIDEFESIINLINADENDEVYKENLQTVVDYLAFAHCNLGATLDRIRENKT